jgi:hypothetical protein
MQCSSSGVVTETRRGPSMKSNALSHASVVSIQLQDVKELRIVFLSLRLSLLPLLFFLVVSDKIVDDQDEAGQTRS